MLQQKYRLRLLWYVCLLLIAGAALSSVHTPIASAFLSALSTYLPMSLVLIIFNLLTSYAYWRKTILRQPASRVFYAMISLGGLSVILGHIIGAGPLVDLSLLAVLAAIDGLITEHELRPKHHVVL